MTTSNINKIVRSNLSLKPWILSKNTSEIVNSYIKKLYKQAPNVGTDKNNVFHLSSKVAVFKPENKGPIRSLKTRDRPTRKSSGNVATTSTAAVSNRLKGCAPPSQATGAQAVVGGAEQILGAVMNQTHKRGAVASLAANRKLLKSPNYKIYGSRRFGSSASSSSASIIRRYESHRRHRASTGAELNFLLRSIGTYPVSKLANLGLTNAVFKYVTPVRNQHMAARSTTNPATLEVSSAIQRDLMIIDGALKDRIALGRTRGGGARDRVERLADEKRSGDPMKGWHHPPSPDLFFSRADEQEVAFAELAQQNRKLRTANKMKQFSYMRPGLWSTVSGFEKNVPESQNPNSKKGINTARSAHSRTAHVSAPRHIQINKSSVSTASVKGRDLLSSRGKDSTFTTTTTTPTVAEGSATKTALTSPTTSPSPATAAAEAGSTNAAIETPSTGGSTTTAASLLAAAALAVSQGPYNFGRFNRSHFSNNRRY